MSHLILEHVHLHFKVHREKSIKNFLIPKRSDFNTFSKDGTVQALTDISLNLQDGDRLAVVGHNGAGKSTLLKVLAGIYPPSAGTIRHSGRISCLFELATGFQMESSGWENIYLRGLMLGETPAGIRQKMNEIAAFSGLGEYLEMPVKYYSSGMFIRLAFSVSTAIQPEILLLDEVMAAGDAGFLAKAQKRMLELMNTTKIMVFVTHSMPSAVEFCNKAIWLEKGSIAAFGEPQQICDQYIQSVKKENDPCSTL